MSSASDETVVPPERKSMLSAMMRAICDQLSTAFAPDLVAQALTEAGTVDTDVDEEDLFAAMGRPFGIRFRRVGSCFRELLDSCHEAAPLVIRGKSEERDLSAKYIVVLAVVKRKRLRVFYQGKVLVVSARWLSHHAWRDDHQNVDWFLIQSSLPVDAASAVNYRTGEIGAPLKPLRRLIEFLKPESGDIRTVVVFSMVIGALSLATPLAVEAIVNTIAFGRYLQPLIVLSLIVLIFLAFSAAIQTLLTVVVEIVQRRLFVRTLDDLAIRLPRVPLAELQKYHGPELVNRFFDIVNVQKITAKLMLSTVLTVLQTVIGMTVLAFYHPFLLGYDVAIIAVMGIILFAIGRGAVRTAISVSQTKYEAAAWLQEIARHPTAFKFNGGTEFAINRADQLAVSYVNHRKAHFRIVIRQIGFTMAMQAVAATALLGLGGYLVISQQMTLGQLVAAELIVTVILGSFAKLGKDLESFYGLLASIDKLGKLFDLPLERQDRLRLSTADGASVIELQNLKVSSGGSPPVNLAVPAGSSLAIVGRSGSGKSRLAETLVGQRNPVSGFVLLDGYRIDGLSADSLQASIGLLREIEIFDGSIDENVRLGRDSISTADLNATIEAVGLRDELLKFEEGTNKKLSIGGYPLGTGQSIRLLLARGLIGNPGLLIIDGVLDRLSDRDIEDVLPRLKALCDETTLIITTGRESIRDWCDDVLEIS